MVFWPCFAMRLLEIISALNWYCPGNMINDNVDFEVVDYDDDRDDGDDYGDDGDDDDDDNDDAKSHEMSNVNVNL